MKPHPIIGENFLIYLLFLLFFNCTEKKEVAAEEATETAPKLFTLLSPDQTGVHFQNSLTEGLNTNVLMYEYLYNGGGVATADFNGDDLIDIYFTSNMSDNKLYVNGGDMKFVDATLSSGASGRPGPWKTGITAVDINADNKMDLYLSYSGAMPEQKRKNQLFINLGNDENGNPLFEDQAEKYGLASPGFSNQAYFFDYDHDGDLDMLLLNHNPKSLPVLNVANTKEFLKKDDPLQGVRLYNQSDGIFKDATPKAGISGSALTYGLGIGISDLNNDGWQDFYVSNDYAVPDYLYMNNADGTFTNSIDEELGHISQFSMGNDIADINNDGWQDVFTLDMIPEDNARQKLLLAPDKYDKFDLNVRSGFHYQYMRNMLQLNEGNGSFSEIGQIAGISNTDWSWAALLADYDNDGFKDLFVTNGYFRDYTNLDFINYMDGYVKSKGRLKREDVLKIIEQMPASDLKNYLFKNKNGTEFSNETIPFGMDQPANSNGAAYADLDNDGDLDLVVNNINKSAFIYRNDTEKQNYLQLKLQGDKLNTIGLGAKATLFSKNKKWVQEQSITRGYLSSVSPIMHFGLGSVEKIDSLTVQWNDGRIQTLVAIDPNQRLVLNERNAKAIRVKRIPKQTFFNEVPSPIAFEHKESEFNDFNRQSLLLHQPSKSGPCMIMGDANNDGLEDIFVGGAKDQTGGLFLQGPNMDFKKKKNPVFELNMESHDTDAVLFDANNDGDLDLYVASGGYHDYEKEDRRLQDRLYFGDGNGSFELQEGMLPKMFTSSGTVSVSDINRDGFLDLFVGGRTIPGSYPEIPRSYILINDGTGKFMDQTERLAPELTDIGMVTDAQWIDVNGDEIEDLIVVGEWMPISVFVHQNGKLQNQTPSYFDRSYSGWWNTIETADLNKDGKPDFIVGNMGANTQFVVSEKEPAELHYKDFDQNGSVDPLFSYYIQGKSYPYVTRDELLGQLAYLRSKFNSYKSYSNATLAEIFSEEELKNAKKLVADHMETTLFLSSPDGKYELATLPKETQYAPIYSILCNDYNADGNQDLLLLGNNHFFKLRLGKFDANYGTLLFGDGKGDFEYVDQLESGFKVKGMVQAAIQIDNTLFFGINQQKVVTYEIAERK